jgi:hypothetical protein
VRGSEALYIALTAMGITSFAGVTTPVQVSQQHKIERPSTFPPLRVITGQLHIRDFVLEDSHRKTVWLNGRENQSFTVPTPAHV